MSFMDKTKDEGDGSLAINGEDGINSSSSSSSSSYYHNNNNNNNNNNDYYSHHKSNSNNNNNNNNNVDNECPGSIYSELKMNMSNPLVGPFSQIGIAMDEIDSMDSKLRSSKQGLTEREKKLHARIRNLETRLAERNEKPLDGNEQGIDRPEDQERRILYLNRYVNELKEEMSQQKSIWEKQFTELSKQIYLLQSQKSKLEQSVEQYEKKCNLQQKLILELTENAAQLKTQLANSRSEYDAKLKRVIAATEVINNAKMGLTFEDSPMKEKMEPAPFFDTKKSPSTSSFENLQSMENWRNPIQMSFGNQQPAQANAMPQTNANANANAIPQTNISQINAIPQPNIIPQWNSLEQWENASIGQKSDIKQDEYPVLPDPSKYKVMALELCTKNSWDIPKESCQILQNGQYYAMVRMGPAGKEATGQGNNAKPKLALYEAYRRAMMQLFRPNEMQEILKPTTEKKHPKCIIMEYCNQNGLSPPVVEHLPNESGMGWVCRVAFLNLVTFGKAATKKDAQTQAFEEIVSRMTDLTS